MLLLSNSADFYSAGFYSDVFVSLTGSTTGGTSAYYLGGS